MNEKLQIIDHRAIQFSQIMVIGLNILAYVLNLPNLALFTGVVCLAGAALSVPGFLFIYKPLKSANLIKPDYLPDHPEPHRFAQLLGGLMTFGGGLLVINGQLILGWALIWIHAALAALNGFGGFCLGCFIYYWIGRMGIPGFQQTPPPGSQPGRRPTEASHDA